MEIQALGQNKLRLFNNLLSIIVAFLALYIILVPLLPNISWWTTHHTPFKSRSNISLPLAVNDKKDSRPKVNTLVIPALNFENQIYDGPTLYELRFGLWHLPSIGDPAKGGNTVIAGHRFTYSGPAIFYHLDKIKVGDKMTIYWNSERYDYEVTASLVVPPNDVAVQNNTKQPMLTLITCTPLWTAANRLIIQAKLTGHAK